MTTRLYLGTAFSPSMLAKGVSVTVTEISEETVVDCWLTLASIGDFKSIVGHESTAEILSHRLGFQVEFNRESIVLDATDVLIVAIPQFRADQAREFSADEIRSASFRWFRVGAAPPTQWECFGEFPAWAEM